MKTVTVYVERPAPVSLIVARVCICVLSLLTVLFGGLLTLFWLGLNAAACQLSGATSCGPEFWPAGLPFTISLACALVAVAAAFLARWAGLTWLIGLIALGIGTVCPMLTLAWALG